MVKPNVTPQAWAHAPCKGVQLHAAHCKQVASVSWIVRGLWLSSCTCRPRVSTQHEPEARTPKEIISDPLRYRPLPASSHVFESRVGVMRVFADESKTMELFPVPGDAAEFFTGMICTVPAVALFTF